MREVFPSKKLLLSRVIEIDNPTNNGETFIIILVYEYERIAVLCFRGIIYLRTRINIKAIPWEVVLRLNWRILLVF